jgi:hypothetical protein
MAAQVFIGLEQRSEYLQRLSVVYTDELRLKIVTELYQREMSPSKFFVEFGGGSVSRVDRHFKRLAKHGWLRPTRKESGGMLRGATENYYRATELAIFDHETWPMLPYSLRAAFSWTSVKQMGERWREAAECGTAAPQSKKSHGHITMLVDQEGWDNVRRAIDNQFVACFNEQVDARLRIAHTGAKPLLATAAFLGFESPMSDDDHPGPELATLSRDPGLPFPWRFSKVLADALCMKILVAANREAISAKTFRAIHGGDIRAIRNRLKRLEGLGWLAKVSEKTGGKRRGAVEKFYRAAAPILDSEDTWKVPRSVKASPMWQAFEEIATSAVAAIRAGTFDQRPDRHTSWSLLRLDRQGLESIVASMEALRSFILDEQRRARDRMAESGEKAICMTIVATIFESPAQARIAL